MNMFNVASTCLGIVLMCSVVGAPILHNVIPHSHGGGPVQDGIYTHDDVDHGHQDQKESAVWSSLHSALRHEDKKLLLVAISVVFACASVVVGTGILRDVRIRTILAQSRLLAAIDPQRGRLLHRGISSYRRFG